MFKNHVFFVAGFVLVFLIGFTAFAAEIGTRENPVPMGNLVVLSDGWQIAVMSVIPDATNTVLNENQFNAQPKPGNQFFLARIQAKYTGSGSDTFSGSYRLRAVGPSSVGYTTYGNSAGVIPDPLPDSEVFSGGVVEGNIGWEIKSSDASALVMYDNPISFGDNKDRVYMALYDQGSTYPATFKPTENDLKWVKLIPDNLRIMAGDMGLVGSALNNLDYINGKKYVEYLKTDVSKALDDSESYIVSEELQTAKDYYKRACNEIYSGATEMIDGINTGNQSRIENAINFHIMEGVRYINLTSKEINMLATANALK
jgi:hypothetical protein